MNYNNISDTTSFTFNIINNSNIVNLMPIIENTNPNITIENNNYIYFDAPISIQNNASFVIYYKIPFDAVRQQSILTGTNTNNIANNIIELTIETTIENNNAPDIENNYETISINYSFVDNSITYYCINNITYYKYLNFNVPTLNITLSNYSYNLLRTNNNIPKNIYNDNYINSN